MIEAGRRYRVTDPSVRRIVGDVVVALRPDADSTFGVFMCGGGATVTIWLGSVAPLPADDAPALRISADPAAVERYEDAVGLVGQDASAEFKRKVRRRRAFMRLALVPAYRKRSHIPIETAPPLPDLPPGMFEHDGLTFTSIPVERNEWPEGTKPAVGCPTCGAPVERGACVVFGHRDGLADFLALGAEMGPGPLAVAREWADGFMERARRAFMLPAEMLNDSTTGSRATAEAMRRQSDWAPPRHRWMPMPDPLRPARARGAETRAAVESGPGMVGPVRCRCGVNARDAEADGRVRCPACGKAVGWRG